MPFDRRQALNLVCLPVSPRARMLFLPLFPDGIDAVPEDPVTFRLNEPQLPLLEGSAMAAHRVAHFLVADDRLPLAALVDLCPTGVPDRPTDRETPAVQMFHHFAMVASSWNSWWSVRDLHPRPRCVGPTLCS